MSDLWTEELAVMFDCTSCSYSQLLYCDTGNVSQDVWEQCFQLNNDN